MKRTVYELFCELKDGSLSYRVGNYTEKETAEFFAKRKKAEGRFKQVKVLEITFEPGRQSTNACMLTIAR